MKVLVTGGAGYIGSHVVLALVHKGHEVVVVDDLSTGRREMVPEEVLFIEGDVGNYGRMNSVIAIQEVEAVIHMAAKTSVEQSVAQPLVYYHENVEKTRQLMTAMSNAGCTRMVFSSSAAVYGDVPLSRLGPQVHESEPCEPINPYGKTKLIAEWMLKDFGMRHVALRYFNVAGADPGGRAGPVTVSGTLIQAACRAALGLTPPLKVFGTDYPTHDGTAVRDYVHVTDIATAHLKALEYLFLDDEASPSKAFNIGYGHGTSVMEVVKALELVMGKRMPVEIASRRPGDPAAVVADPTAAKVELRWRPGFDDITTIVADALAWEEKQCRPVPK